MALVTRLSRQSRPSPRWEPLPAYSSLEERPWHGNGPLCLVRRGLPPPGQGCKALGCAGRDQPHPAHLGLGPRGSSLTPPSPKSQWKPETESPCLDSYP